MPDERLSFPAESRRTAIRSLVAAALMGGGMSALIRAALADERRPVPPGMHKMSGAVHVNGQPASVGQLVRPGDSVTTGPGAEAVFVIGQDAFLQREQSAVDFGADAAKGFFRVVSGKILSVFGRGEKTLLTPTATIGIRGTGCYIEAAPSSTYFCLCYGVAEVVPLADPARARILETWHHDRPVWVQREAGMGLMADAKMVNHADAELTLLESLVGRRPPFYGKALPAMGAAPRPDAVPVNKDGY